MNAPALVKASPAPDATPAGAFRAAMRHLVSGVSLVTHGEGRAKTGMTATSVVSLSSEPPTLLVCVNRSASLYRGLKPGEGFGISVLSADQSEAADVFAGRTGLQGEDRFRHGRWVTTRGGVELLAGALAAFDCEVEETIERHTHAIVVGRVRQAFAGEGGGALLYWRGAYDQLGWRADEVSRAVGVTPDARGPAQLRASWRP